MKRELNFENFYIHEGNDVAYLAAQRVIEFPGELFNPFYVCGGIGLGKTHLLQAINFELGKKSTVLFFTAQEFEKYLEENRKIDTPIIVDDLHTISAKYQRVLWEIIDVSLANNWQLCFSGDLVPRDLKNFDAKLVSRLEGGLVCDLQPPKETVLLDMIRKKSEDAGINLSDEVISELTQLSNGSTRAIDGMINRLRAKVSLGNVSLDLESVRSILKEFYPRGIYSPVESLLHELKKNAVDVLQNVSKTTSVRDGYREKIYIWKMKGFNTSSLESSLDGDIELLEKTYEDFIQKVERLTKIQREFSELDTGNFPVEAMKIELMLFSLDHVDIVEKFISDLTERIEKPKPQETFNTFIIGESNRNAYNVYRNQVLKSLGEKLNPFIIRGKKGTGKTHFLEAISSDLRTHNKSVLFFDLAKEQELLASSDIKNIDVIILDNLPCIFATQDDKRKRIFELIMNCIKADKEVIVSTNVSHHDLSLAKDENIIFELGLEVELNEPSPELVLAYVESKLDPARVKEIIDKGLLKFTSFYEVNDYLNYFSTEALTELVPLGLPGEEISEPPIKGEKSKWVSVRSGHAKAIKEERYVFPDVFEELIEENY